MSRKREGLCILIFMVNIVWSLENLFGTITDKENKVNLSSVYFLLFCTIFISILTGIIFGLAIAEDFLTIAEKNESDASSAAGKKKSSARKDYGACLDFPSAVVEGESLL